MSLLNSLPMCTYTQTKEDTLLVIFHTTQNMSEKSVVDSSNFSNETLSHWNRFTEVINAEEAQVLQRFDTFFQQWFVHEARNRFVEELKHVISQNGESSNKNIVLLSSVALATLTNTKTEEFTKLMKGCAEGLQDTVQKRNARLILLYMRAAASHQSGHLEQAINDYSTILEEELYAVVYANRGTMYRALRRFPEAVADLSKAVEMDPNLIVAYINRAGIYLEHQMYVEAIHDCSRSLQISPNIAIGYCLRGSAYLQLGKHKETISDCTKAINLDPSIVQTYFSRAVAYLGRRRYSEAIADCTQALSIDPNIPHTYMIRGLAYLGQEKTEEAVNNFDTAKKLNPSYQTMVEGIMHEYYNKQRGAQNAEISRN
jgi:tetratricopeptide (TPR) repeat protein